MGWRDDLREGRGHRKHVIKCDVEGVLCAGLQSHDVEETAVPCNLVGRVEGTVNEDSDICGVTWVSQVELHTHTAHWDVRQFLSIAIKHHQTS